MNKFSIVVAALQLCAGGEALYHHHYKLAILCLCYAIASTVMAFMKS